MDWKHQSRRRMIGCTASCLIIAAGAVGVESYGDPPWSGEGEYRVLVTVDAADIQDRSSDEMVAACAIDFKSLLDNHDIDGDVALSSLQVHRLDNPGRKPEAFKPFQSARSGYDRPCRFDDENLPEDYPSRVGRASETQDGRSVRVIRKRKARLFNREVDSQQGKLIWIHTQRGDAASEYAIYFDVVPRGAAVGPSPAPWIGDVDVLRRREGQPLGGFSHFTVTAGDLNGDGLFDLVAGTEKGDVMWFPNRGERGRPLFVGCRIVTDEKGPIDTGWYGAPFLFDWNGDGRVDLLVGTSGNVVLWWQNIGDAAAPRFAYRGFVQAEDDRLRVPEDPVAEDPTGIFARDYYNQPWIGDWNGDGRTDLLTGGYTTGRIFFFQCAGSNEQGVPQLSYFGPLHADGAPVDTTWGAAPYAHDFDHDGTLDLVTGSWWWSGIRHAPEPGQVEYLMYYRNHGSPSSPLLKREPFPKEGAFPSGVLARPSVVDWDDDGLPDLLVSDSGGNVHLFLNVGTRGEPKWRMSHEGLTIPWGFVSGFTAVGAFADLTGDQRPEVVDGNTVRTIRGSPYSPTMARVGSISVHGRAIDHPGPGYGDPYRYTTLADWDKDGRVDLLWGTHQGNVYLHRNLGGEDSFSFAEGVLLKLQNGQPLQVGPAVVESAERATDFTILQGSRIVLTVRDFDGDKIDDLIVTETYGNMWVFRNTESGGTSTLAPGVKVATLPGRTGSLACLDVNSDGKWDLIAEGTADRPGLVLINTSSPSRPSVADPVWPYELPYVFWGPSFQSLDWNGDGDDDLMIQSEFFSFWAEQSFLRHAYRPATLIETGSGTIIQKRHR